MPRLTLFGVRQDQIASRGWSSALLGCHRSISPHNDRQGCWRGAVTWPQLSTRRRLDGNADSPGAVPGAAAAPVSPGQTPGGTPRHATALLQGCRPDRIVSKAKAGRGRAPFPSPPQKSESSWGWGHPVGAEREGWSTTWSRALEIGVPVASSPGLNSHLPRGLTTPPTCRFL